MANDTTTTEDSLTTAPHNHTEAMTSNDPQQTTHDDTQAEAAATAPAAEGDSATPVSTPDAEAQPAADEAPAAPADAEAAPSEAEATSDAKTAADTEDKAPAVSPSAPKPAAVPTPGSVSHAPRPAAATPATPTHSVEELAERGRKYGRVDEKNVVFVRDGDQDVEVGSFVDVPEDEALAYFVRKFDEVAGQLTLAEQRLDTERPPVKDIAKTLRGVAESIAEPYGVGDVADVRTRLAAAEEKLAAARKIAEEQRAQAKAEATAAREEIVAAAEKIAGTPPANVSWKNAGDEMTKLFAQWKEMQKQGPRLDKPVEDGLWQRFRGARNSFDRGRRAHFSALDKQHGEAKAAKEALIKEAEELSTTTDWKAGTAAYRDLMARWKKTPRAGRKDDDALWERFRKAQDVFFEARNAASSELDKEYEGNLAVKEKLLEEAEALLPIKNVGQAKKAMRDIGERWDAAGKVPRNAMNRVESRLRAVEQAIRQVESDKWKSSNPEGKARAEGALSQLHDAIAKIERDLEKAREAGKDKKVKELEDSLKARKAWLEQIEKAAADFS